MCMSIFTFLFINDILFETVYTDMFEVEYLNDELRLK